MYLRTEQMQQWYRQYERNHNGRPPVNFNIRDEKKGNAALHLALEMVTKSPDINEMIHQLLSGGADPNLANDAGETALHALCKRDNVECQDDDELVKFFLGQCDAFGVLVQLDVRDGRGHTALEYAAANLLPNAVELLLRRGADLASFRFPSVALFNEFIWRHYRDFEVRTACGILALVERLERAGYQMTRSDATTIMKIFIGNDLYMRSDDPDRYFYLQERFVRKAAGINLSIPDSVQEMERQRLFERARMRPQGPTTSDAVPLAAINPVQVHVSSDVTITSEVFELARQAVDLRIATEPEGCIITVIISRDHEAEAKAGRRGIVQAQLERQRRIAAERRRAQLVAGVEVSQRQLEREAVERSNAEARFLARTEVLRVRIRSQPAASGPVFEAQQEYERLRHAGKLRVEETFHDLCLARPERTEELLAYEDNSRFSDPRNHYRIPVQFPRVCGVHLCEKLARGLFRRWALEPFQRLQAGGHCRRQLSRTCCELILKQLRNEDLWRICLAVEVEAEEEQTAVDF